MANASGKVDPDGLLLWGVDELLTYHYLVAEVFRAVPTTVLSYEQFFKLTRKQQAEHIWYQLFVERTPISEACRGILTTLQRWASTPMKKRSIPTANSSRNRTQANSSIA